MVIPVDPEVLGAGWAIHIKGARLEEEGLEAAFHTGMNRITGLSLAICLQIAARLNGEVTYSCLGL